ncbi:Signal peptide, CUB and EGF-like domain-containing 3 [Paramuricea clavata]|uniref:Signal peptide, CUB and EGF-like domain-containing 3 n=1 Tax=Paramuricea clavata TaxID=317549 RepID=A0A7D9LW31_PARCT|nr:Signal peptide, CUB and EGF-like domain-containing 3 [Paramuricea clavata]
MKSLDIYSNKNYISLDIDECINEPNSNCSEDAICNNTIGSYQCICKNGYLGDGIQCEDINECTATPPKCTGEDKRCTNYPGAYRCNCISPRQQLTKDESACINVSASVRGEIQIINLPFIPAYSDTSSSEYFETTQRITSQVWIFQFW